MLIDAVIHLILNIILISYFKNVSKTISPQSAIWSSSTFSSLCSYGLIGKLSGPNQTAPQKR